MSLEQWDQGNTATPTVATELAVEADEPLDPPTPQHRADLQLCFLSDVPDTNSVSTVSLSISRWRAFLQRVMAKLHIRSQRYSGGKWETKADVIIRGDGKDISKCFPVVIIFDTQCHVDIASTHLLKGIFGLTLDYSAPRCIGKTIIGGDINSVGEVDLRWWGRDRKKFRPRFEELRAFVVESNEFELIIGRETMKRVLVNPGNSMIGTFISNPSSHDAKTVAAAQQDANVRRNEHKAERQRRKEQKTKAPNSQHSQSQSQS